MPRKIPAARLDQLVDCATRVFIEQGYRRTQMADVADALGVAKGTLYLYVESKEALFDLVVRQADAPRPLPVPPKLPFPTPKRGTTLKYVQQRLEQNQTLPVLAAALERRKATDPAAEIVSIVGELYDVLYRNRRAIKLIDRAAVDRPDLARLWFEGARGGAMDAFVQYLEPRVQAGQMRGFGDLAVTARLVIETVTFWAVHRHWDPHPQAVDDAVARDIVLQFIVDAIIKE